MEKNNIDHFQSYGVFCVATRMLDDGYDLGALDELWDDAILEYEEFLNSEFNVDTKSELDCIDEYFSNKD